MRSRVAGVRSSVLQQFSLWSTALAALALTVSGCEAAPDEEPKAARTDAVPLSDLSASALARFQAGAREFDEIEGSGEGLGPLFNASSCGQCHNTPRPGGASIVRVTRVACRERTEPQDTLLHLFSTRPDLGAAGVPERCDAVASQRRTTSLFGAGLIEAIADDEIESLAERQPSEVAGRVAHVKDLVSGKRRVGRFGWKSQHATLDSFAGDAYRNEMGITNELFPTEVAPHGNTALLQAMDPTPDPEAQVGSLGRLADFMRLLAAPEPRDEQLEGEALFDQLGCETCHNTAYRTISDEPALNGREVRLYSDLLLHDVGTGDGIAQGDAGENELRTPPLWGVRDAQLWLHDGRAASLDEAIRFHAGQALPSRQAYERLLDEERAQLIAFLNSL